MFLLPIISAGDRLGSCKGVFLIDFHVFIRHGNRLVFTDAPGSLCVLDDIIDGNQIFFLVVNHPFNIGLIIAVIRKRNPASIFIDRMNLTKAKFSPVFRAFIVLQNSKQQFLIRFAWILACLLNIGYCIPSLKI